MAGGGFPYQQVKLPDCQANWDYLTGNVLELVGSGAKKVNWGTANLTYGASATTTGTPAVVLHKLGAVPVFVGAMTKNFQFGEGGPDMIGCSPAPDATSMSFWGRRAAAVPAGGLVVPFFWVAIA